MFSPAILLVLSLLLAWETLPLTYALPQSVPDPQLTQLRHAILSGQYRGAQLGLLHLQLAMTLQQQWFSKQISGAALSEALDAYNEAFRLMEEAREARKSVEVAFHRGLLLKVMGRGEESLASYRAAFKYALSNADVAALRYNIADSELMLGRVDAALRNYAHALRLAPCKTERYYGQVLALKEQNTFSRSEWAQHAERLIAVERECALWAQQRETERRAREKEAQRLQKTQKKLQRRGESDERQRNEALLAILALDEEDDGYADEESSLATEHSHTATRNVTNDSTHNTTQSGETETETEKELFDDDYMPSVLFSADPLSLPHSLALDDHAVLPAKPSDLLYAIYIAADQARDRETAWRYLVRANDAERDSRSSVFNREEAVLTKNATVQIFNEDLVESFPDITGKASRVPVFVVGMMRSGSTLIETMLDAHPLIWGMGEDSVFNANLTLLRDAIVQATTQGPQSPQKLREILLDYGRSTVQGMKNMVRQTLGDDAMNKGKKKKNVDKDFKKMRHIVDKMLFNYRNIGFINAVFPEALIIHMVRDPLDTLFSMYRQKFDDQGLEWSLDIKDLVLQFVLYIEYMAHFRALLPGRVLDIRYEELVNSPESILREVIEKRLRLSWDEKVLEFHSSQRVVLTNSQSQVRQKLYKHSMGGWRAYGAQLQPIIDEWHRYLPALRGKKMLPFAEEVNWSMDRDFDYDREKDRGSAAQRNPRREDKSAADSGTGGKKGRVVAGARNLEL